MAVRCPHCGQEHDIALFQFGKKIKCNCGKVFGLNEANIEHKDKYDFLRDLCHEIEVNKEDQRIQKIQREADKICEMILNPSFSKVDVELAKSRLYSLCLDLFPDKIWLYDLIFESRFKRIWKQFRQSDGS